MKIGIDAVSFYVPSVYLPIESLASARNIDPDKLKLGLGLEKMALPESGEDTATMAAEALYTLLRSENIHPSQLSRVYLGTESALDAAKPTATYAVQMAEEKGEDSWGKRSFKHCDVVDMTFACIGATDALQNCIDYIRLNPDEMAVVIASDVAKYDLGSTGEYTQGAGAVAFLIKAQPRILAFGSKWGVGMESVHDFFKPKRSISKSTLATELGIQFDCANPALFGITESYMDFTKESPVFDGQFSNQCYTDRMKEAYSHYMQKNGLSGVPFDDWAGIIFHLPYAFHGKRMFADLFAEEYVKNGKSDILASETGVPVPDTDSEDWKEFVKKAAKTPTYKSIVDEKIEDGRLASSEIGNMYTASVFMSLLSFLNAKACKLEELSGKTLGFIAYGSGSKSKVFSAEVQQGWAAQILRVRLDDTLAKRTPISFEMYETLHKKESSIAAVRSSTGFRLKHIEKENPVAIGARTYANN
ncbi:MAG: hydroxymethylglutaryl-CoA synthase family protein [Flavobacteriales bacterium]